MKLNLDRGISDSSLGFSPVARILLIETLLIHRSRVLRSCFSPVARILLIETDFLGVSSLSDSSVSVPLPGFC